MKALPHLNQDYSALFNVLMAPVRAKLMMTAIELDVFSSLTEFRSANEVAQVIETHPENTRRFLDGLAMIDLLEKKAGLYRNLPTAQTFLVAGKPYYLGPLFLLSQTMSVDSLDNLIDLVKNGPRPTDQLDDFGDENLWAEGARAGAGWVLGGVGQLITGIVSQLPEFPDFSKMLDLGGGHGIFCLYLVASHPSMHGVVFDQPAVAPIAWEFIEEYELQDRITVVGGDYTHDELGNGYDLIWASATLNFVKYDMDVMLTKIYNALNPGGIFISFQDGMTHEQTKPETMLGHLAQSITAGTDLYLDQGFIANSALRCGFQSVHSRTIETPMGALDMDIARKQSKED